ncbi:MAG: hypothetical protein ACOYMG_07970 [Candidatus Methylumidiphilus sp.]
MSVDRLLLRKAAEIAGFPVDSPPDELSFHQIIDLLIIDLLTHKIDAEKADSFRKKLAADTRSGIVVYKKSGVLRWLHGYSPTKVDIEERPLSDDEITILENGGMLWGKKAIYDDMEAYTYREATLSIFDGSKKASYLAKDKIGPFIHWNYCRVSIAEWIEYIGHDSKKYPYLQAWLESSKIQSDDKKHENNILMQRRKKSLHKWLSIKGNEAKKKESLLI